MSNSALIVQGPDTQSPNSFLQIKVIDNLDGTRSLRFVDQPTPGLPALASQIQPTGDVLLASAAASIAIGTTITGGTPGSVLFVGAGPVLAQDNANLFWDDTNKRLGIGTNTPSSELHILNANWQPAAGSNHFVNLNATRLNSSTAQLLSLNLVVTGGGFANMIIGSNTANTANVSAQSSLSLTNTLSGVQATTSSITITANLFITSGGSTPLGQAIRANILQNNAASASGTFNIIEVDALLSAGSIADLRGLFVGGWTLGATITNSDGLLIDNTIPNTLSTHFAIRSLSTAPSLISGILRFSGSTNAFPALFNSGAELQCLLADNSDFAAFRAAALSLNIRTDAGATVTVTASDFTILCDATAGNQVVDLPVASTVPGNIYNVKKIDPSANTVTITPNAGAGDLIDGAATQVISAQWESFQIQSDGADWFIL